MSADTLYSRPNPFRGQLIRSALAHVGADWNEPVMETVARLKQVAPHMSG